jgi:hypothetical protein
MRSGLFDPHAAFGSLWVSCTRQGSGLTLLGIHLKPSVGGTNHVFRKVLPPMPTKPAPMPMPV